MKTNKPVKRVISFVIYHSDQKRFLIVQRPADDDDLPNLWGLPAGSLRPEETWKDAVRRSGKEKLGVELEIGSCITEGSLERQAYTLEMKEYEATIIQGEPQVPQPVQGVTQYQSWKWGTASDLQEAAKKGSLCCRLFLDK